MNADFYTDYKGTFLVLIIVLLFFGLIGYVFLPIVDNEPYILNVFVMILPILAFGFKCWLKKSNDKYNLLKRENWINLGLLLAFFSFALCEKFKIYLIEKLDSQILLKNINILVLLIYYLTCISVYFTGIILKKNDVESDFTEEDNDLNIFQKGVAVILIVSLAFLVPNWYCALAKSIVCYIFIKQAIRANGNNFVFQVIIYIGLVFLFNPVVSSASGILTWQAICVISCLFLIISTFVNRRNEKIRYIESLRKKYENEGN